MSRVDYYKDIYILLDGQNLPFPGAFTSKKMPKEDLIPFIQKKSQKCLLHVDEPDKREHYYFLNKMELFCEQHGDLKFLYASKPFKSGFTAQAPDYRATITGAVTAFPDRPRNTLLYKHQLRGLSEKLHGRKIEEPGYWRNRCLLLDDGEAALSNSSTEQKQDTETTPSPEVPSTLESYLSRAQEHRDFLVLTEEFASKYTIGDLLGHGGGGAVYEGVRKADDTEVAIKFVTSHDDYGMMTIPGQTRVVPVEVGLMEMVNKPSCSPYVLELLEWFKIPIYDILILEQPRPCMSLLDFCWYHGGRLPEALARKIMLQVVQAASWCCDCGVFHNDIKPENFLINTETLQVKLIDFGYGDLLKDSPYTYCPGTDGYHPPEWYHYGQYMARPATVWSLGIVLFQLVHGDVPFQTHEEVTNGCLHFAPGLSKDCCKLISSCLNQDPESRPTFEKILKHKWFMEEKHNIERFPVIRYLAKLFGGLFHK